MGFLRQKIWFRWAVSYLPAFLLALVLGSLLYLSAIQTVEKKAETIQRTILQERADSLAKLFDEIGKTAIQVQGNNVLKKLSGKQEWAAKEQLELKELQKLLQTYWLAQEEIAELCIYFPEQEYWLGTNHMISLKREDILQDVTGFQKRDLFSLFSEDLYGTLHAVGSKLIYTSTCRKKGHFLEQPAIILVYLEEEALQELLEITDLALFLADAKGRCYPAGEEGLPGGLSRQEVLELPLSKEAVQWLGSACVFQNEIKKYPLTLYSVQSDVAYLSGLHKMRLLLLAYLFVCLIIGGCLISVQARRNYKPVGDMLALLRRQGYTTGVELSHARESLERMAAEYDRRQDTIRQQEEQLLACQLQKLFSGREEVAEIESLPVGEEKYQLVQLWIEEIEETGLEEELLTFMLHNVLQEVLEPEGIELSVFGHVNHRYYLISEIKGGTGIPAARLEQVCCFFETACSMDVFAEISSIHKGREGICMAYDEVCAMKEGRIFLSGHMRVVSYADQRFKDKIGETVKRLAARRHLLYQLSGQDREALEEAADLYFKQLKGQQTDLLGERKETRKIEEIKHYIEAHYTEQQLSVGSLARQFGVSDSWLSRNFKKETGDGVLKYIGELRMKKAKELLQEGMSVSQSAEAVGYYDSRPLVRLFVQKEGLTPMEYRKKQKNPK